MGGAERERDHFDVLRLTRATIVRWQFSSDTVSEGRGSLNPKPS